MSSEPSVEWTRADVPVVFEDDDLLVVDKPAGLVVHPAPGHPGTTLAELFSGEIAGGDSVERAGIVHRLDRGTSGLMILAKSPEAHATLQRMIGERAVERGYLALVEGSPRTRSGRIDAPIGRSARERHRMAIDGAGARAAVSHFEVKERFADTSLLSVRLETGRTHQIRVHMKAIGTPIVGDPTYGGSNRFGLERPFLHSARLEFEHPVKGGRMVFEAPLPNDLEQAVGRARAPETGGSG